MTIRLSSLSPGRAGFTTLASDRSPRRSRQCIDMMARPIHCPAPPLSLQSLPAGTPAEGATGRCRTRDPALLSELTLIGYLSVRRRRGARRQAGGRGARERHRRGDLPVTADPGEANADPGAAWTDLGAEHVTAAPRAAGRQPRRRTVPRRQPMGARERFRIARAAPGPGGSGHGCPELARTAAVRAGSCSIHQWPSPSRATASAPARSAALAAEAALRRDPHRG